MPIPYPTFHHLTILVVITAAPLCTQAALPEPIQIALTKAALTPDNISMLIVPVGDKTTSRLPPIIHVIDSDNISHRITNNDSTHENTNRNTAVIRVNKQALKYQEQQLNDYTDDPYTHQSLESVPTVVPNGYHHKIINSDTLPKVHSTDYIPLVTHNSNVARTPASTMKLIPSLIALDILGADFVWFTRVFHTGVIIGDRLYGNLIIQGSGDPKMTHKRLGQLLYHVQQAGIRHINGNIILDSSVFNNVNKNPAAFDRAPLRPYNASPNGFLINLSSIGVYSHLLNDSQAQLTYIPQLANYKLPSQIDTRIAACAQAQYSLAPAWQADQLILNAKLPNSCGEHIFYVAYPNAQDFAAQVVEAKWQALGNTISGNVVAQESTYSPYKATKNIKPAQGLTALSVSPLPIVSYPSLNLTQQIYDINHFSNNVMTEQVALSIGSYSKPNRAMPSSVTAKTDTNSTTLINKRSSSNSLYQFGKPMVSDYPQALQVINEWWQTNLTTSPPIMTNGSGLCRDCTVSAVNLSELLSYAYKHPSFDAYVNSLGVAGVSGTISRHSERLPVSNAIGRAWIKTGTLNNVSAMAGYVKGLSGQDYTVVGIINTKQAISPDDARPVLDAMLDWSAQQ